MAYFSNGTDGMQYEAKYCDKCVHMSAGHGCPCWDAHMFWNYEECNKKDSILHKMIPQADSGFAAECIFFREGSVKIEKHEHRFKLKDGRVICSCGEKREFTR